MDTRALQDTWTALDRKIEFVLNWLQIIWGQLNNQHEIIWFRKYQNVTDELSFEDFMDLHFLKINLPSSNESKCQLEEIPLEQKLLISLSFSLQW